MRMVHIQRGGRLYKCDERLAKALDGRAGYLRRDVVPAPGGGSAISGEASSGKKNVEGAKPGKRGRKPAAQKEPTE